MVLCYSGHFFGGQSWHYMGIFLDANWDINLDVDWDDNYDADWDSNWDVNWDANQRPKQRQILKRMQITPLKASSRGKVSTLSKK